MGAGMVEGEALTGVSNMLWAGDYAALKERGRAVARTRLEEIA